MSYGWQANLRIRCRADELRLPSTIRIIGRMFAGVSGRSPKTGVLRARAACRIRAIGGRTMTADEPRLRVTTNLAFGICLILLGTALMLDRLQLVDASQILRFWPVGLVLFGAALVIQSFQRVDATSAARRSSRPTAATSSSGSSLRSSCRRCSTAVGSPRATDSSETVNVFAVMSASSASQQRAGLPRR